MAWAILFSLLDSVGVILGAALRGAAFPDMIPKGLEQAPALAVTGTVLAAWSAFSSWRSW